MDETQEDAYIVYMAARCVWQLNGKASDSLRIYGIELNVIRYLFEDDDDIYREREAIGEEIKDKGHTHSAAIYDVCITLQWQKVIY